MPDEPTRALLAAIAARTAAERIRMALLRGERDLPQPQQGDVDLLVHPQDLPQAVRAIEQAGHSSGWRVLFQERIANHTHVVLWRDAPGATAIPSVHFDLQDALGRRGLRYARAEPLLELVAPGPWLPVLQSAPRVLALALHVLLDKGAMKEEQRRTLLYGDLEQVEALAPRILQPSVAARVVSWLGQGAPEGELPRVAKGLRRRLYRSDPASCVRSVTVRVSRWARMLGPRRGLLVAFLGPDGAGKSSVVRAVAEAFPKGPFPVSPVYFGKRDTFLPTSRLIRKVYAKREGDGRPSHRERQQTVVARLKDGLGLLNWYAEQWARYWAHARPVLQQGGMVLADRYAYDVANRDPGSVAHTAWFRRLMLRTFPRPDATYLLAARPQILHERKPEATEEDSRLLLERLRAIVADVPGSREVSTERPLAETTAEITRELVRLFERRRR